MLHISQTPKANARFTAAEIAIHSRVSQWEAVLQPTHPRKGKGLVLKSNKTPPQPQTHLEDVDALGSSTNILDMPWDNLHIHSFLPKHSCKNTGGSRTPLHLLHLHQHPACPSALPAEQMTTIPMDSKSTAAGAGGGARDQQTRGGGRANSTLLPRAEHMDVPESIALLSLPPPDISVLGRRACISVWSATAVSFQVLLIFTVAN